MKRKQLLKTEKQFIFTRQRMHIRNAAVSLHVAVAGTLCIILFIFFVVVSNVAAQLECSRTCAVENCNTIGIRYGKYCGVGWTGCPGEKPCDDLDACCQIHDQCVAQNGLTNIKCHEQCRRCVKKVEKSGKIGFSRDCPYDAALPTLLQCMEMSILFSQIDASETEHFNKLVKPPGNIKAEKHKNQPHFVDYHQGFQTMKCLNYDLGLCTGRRANFLLLLFSSLSLVLLLLSMILH